MKLAIFGATGRTGKPLVEQALAAGHDVTAFVRTPSKMPITHDRLTLVQGDVRNAADVARAIEGADVVYSVIGPDKPSGNELLQTAARNIVSAMKHHGVRRVIWLTGAGVAAPEDQPKLINHVIKFALKTSAPAVLKDSETAVDIVRTSGLDWTVVRGPMLTEGPHTGSYRVGWVGVNTGPRISRADLADFMLTQAGDRTFVGKAPMVSN